MMPKAIHFQPNVSSSENLTIQVNTKEMQKYLKTIAKICAVSLVIITSATLIIHHPLLICGLLATAWISTYLIAESFTPTPQHTYFSSNFFSKPKQHAKIHFTTDRYGDIATHPRHTSQRTYTRRYQ